VLQVSAPVVAAFIAMSCGEDLDTKKAHSDSKKAHSEKAHSEIAHSDRLIC
jgi:hypothetical protein